jgi:hypothetical protein
MSMYARSETFTGGELKGPWISLDPSSPSNGGDSMFRISQPGSDDIIDVNTVEEIEPALRDSTAVCYHVDEISAHPLPSGQTSKRWGIVIKWRDGAVFLEPDPRPA